MSQRILLQTLLKFRDRIKDGSAKVQDIITDYFNQTGKSVTDDERAFILDEFAKEAPDNITTLEGVDPRETIMPMGGVETTYKPVTGKINYPQMEKFLGVKLRGNETFDELLEIERQSKESREGIGSLFPKGKGATFEKIDDRDEVAEFIRNMRGAGIKNPDIRGVFKEFGTDIEGGKRAATTLARAADMGADTAKKQELLSELDEMKMDEGPRFFQEEYMGFDDFRSAIDAKKIEVNNAIVDDLEKMGVADEDVMRIMGKARELNKNNFFITGEEFVDIIKEELEFNNINYNVDFYKNYFKELTRLMRKPEPRFMFGGAV